MVLKVSSWLFILNIIVGSCPCLFLNAVAVAMHLVYGNIFFRCIPSYAVTIFVHFSHLNMFLAKHTLMSLCFFCAVKPAVGEPSPLQFKRWKCETCRWEDGDWWAAIFFLMVTGGDKVPTWIFRFSYIWADPEMALERFTWGKTGEIYMGGGKHQGAAKHCSQAAMASSWSPGRRTRQRHVSSRQIFSSRGRQGCCPWKTAAFLCFQRFHRHNSIKVEAVSAGTHAGAP
jgi:hypothetical protein